VKPKKKKGRDRKKRDFQEGHFIRRYVGRKGGKRNWTAPGKTNTYVYSADAPREGSSGGGDPSIPWSTGNGEKENSPFNVEKLSELPTMWEKAGEGKKKKGIKKARLYKRTEKGGEKSPWPLPATEGRL